MSIAKKGSKVKVHYTGKLTDGEVFDSSKGREPLEFEIGAGMMIKGFDTAVEGMSIGETKEAHIVANEAYGDKREDLIMEFPKDQLPPEITPEVGAKLAMHSQGQQIPVTITKVSEATIEIDANHELAGKDLIFEIELVEVN